MLCVRCNSTGEYLGAGMMLIDCELCAAEERSATVKVSEAIKIDRNSASYKKAIKDIMQLDKSLTRDDAVKMFEKEFSK